jgi:hypothetical protein
LIPQKKNIDRSVHKALPNILHLVETIIQVSDQELAILKVQEKYQGRKLASPDPFRFHKQEEAFSKFV